MSTAFLLYQRGRGGNLGWGVRFGFCLVSFLLPFQGAQPVFFFIFVKFCFPFADRFLAGRSHVLFGVAPHAVAMSDVVEQFLLEFAGDGFTVDSRLQIRSLQTRGKRTGVLVGGALLVRRLRGLFAGTILEASLLILFVFFISDTLGSCFVLIMPSTVSPRSKGHKGTRRGVGIIAVIVGMRASG